jgi:Tfp pilus assembly protein PilF
MPGPSKNPAKVWLIVSALLCSLSFVGLGVWYAFRPDSQDDDPAPPPKGDPVRAAHANARGIGYMEQYLYDKAIEAFAEAVSLDPDWTPARINLGIARLNRGNDVPEELDKALAEFRSVLDRDPNDPHALFCTGIIHFYRGDLSQALPFFEAVTRIDPNDPHAWYYRGMSRLDSGDSRESYECFEKALALNPYLNAARHAVAQHSITADDEKRKLQLIAEFQELANANAQDLSKIAYTEMGRYGDCIGRSPLPPHDAGVFPLFESLTAPRITLAEGTRWAKPEDLDELRRAIRSRFGGGLLVLDYDRDGRPDLLLLGAVVRGGGVGDLLLRNTGDFTFTDVTAAMGLDRHPGSLGGAVGDYDNDDYPDLVLTGVTGLKLLRNRNGQSFEDRTIAAGFATTAGVYLSATWVDLDQDGDLDLAAARYAATPELAVARLRSEATDETGGLVVFANVGEAPAAQVGRPMPPLTTAFKPLTGPADLLVKGPVTGLVATDLDADLDIDLLVFLDGQPPVSVLNDRLLRFHRGSPVTDKAGATAGLVLDANGDDQTDLLLVGERATEFRISTTDTPGLAASRFVPAASNTSPLRSAAWVDLDLDGRTDILGVSADRRPVFLHRNGAGQFSRKLSPFGPDADNLADLLAAVGVDLDGDSTPDVLLWSEAGGLRFHRSLGNGNYGLKLVLTGKRVVPSPGETGKPLRTNADAVGAWVRLHAGPLRTAAENTTLFAGLGQSRVPLLFGLGKADGVDALRVRWPDSVVQAELNQSAGLVSVAESDRKPSSCPVLFAWDGERFAYVTDFLGAGAVGETGPDGSVRPPRPEESVKIEPGRLAPKNGRLVVKVTEPMDEVMYLDRFRLDVIDHPNGVSVYPDERFATSGPPPTQELFVFRDEERVFAAKATDHRGRDVTETLKARDGRHVEGFALRSWLGYAEDHFVELDFAGRLQDLPARRRHILVLAGWIDYPFPESIYAATQAGVPTVAPVLEQRQPDGTWKALTELGFPAGLTRVMTVDVTGKIDPNGGPVRIRTNLQIYWDQLFIAPVAGRSDVVVRELPVLTATLRHRGFAQEYNPDGKPPVAYDYDRLEPVSVTRWRGKLTRTGDVTELLQEADDRHAVCGPGDEVTVEFDASGLPTLPPGASRSFVLRTWGYCKDAAPTTLTGGSVGPLPYRDMPRYPYDPVKEPPPPRLVDYDRLWNTRPVGGR